MLSNHFCFPFSVLLLNIFLWTSVDGFISRRAKCAIECYIKCANSGTPKAVYCNCPLNIESDPCNSISEQLLTEKTVERQIESDSGYKDIRNIWLKVETVSAAFIYIFEFAIQSADQNKPMWTFAGASSSPQITLSIPDSCRDYQFRAIVVLRSTDPIEQFVVFRPKAIPAQFPAFTVPKESVQCFSPSNLDLSLWQIHLERPKQSSDDQTLHLSVSWQHPPGYDDSDVYGYSPPIAYPIRCHTPDDRLSSPRLELIQGGAKVHLALPVDVLREQCRIYMEVRMLPRCVRIEPFDLQNEIILDCQKFPELRYCQKERSPKCTDVVDLWGKDNGKLIVVWQRPSPPSPHPNGANPLFYIVNWGAIAQAEEDQSPVGGSRPKIVHPSQQRVLGNQTKLELSGVRAGIQYGLQICGFFTEIGDRIPPETSPFRIVPIIPFNCQKCQNGKGAQENECIDCSKEEEHSRGTTVASNGKLRTTFSGPDPDHSHSSPHSFVHFISSDTVVLDVFGANVSVGGTTEPMAPTPTKVGEAWKREEEEEEGRKEHGKGGERKETERGENKKPGHHSSNTMGNELAKDETKATTTETTTVFDQNEKERMTENALKASSTTLKPIAVTKEMLSNDLNTVKEEKEEEEAVRRGKTEEGMRLKPDTVEQKEEHNAKEIRRMEERKKEERVEKGEEEERRTEEEKEVAMTQSTDRWPEVGEKRRTSNSQRTSESAQERSTKGEEQSDQTTAMPTTSEMVNKTTTTTITTKGTTMRTILSKNSEKFDEVKQREMKEEEKTANGQKDGSRKVTHGSGGGSGSGGEAEGAIGSLRFVDAHRWIVAAPAFFLFGLFAGLCLFLAVLVRRHCRRQRAPLSAGGRAISTFPAGGASKYMETGAGRVKIGPASGGRSVLAARTLATSGGCFIPAGRGGHGATIGFIGAPTINTGMPLPQSGSSSSASSAGGSSSASSATTVESRIGTSGTNGTTSGASSGPNFFADNTARFFMHPPPAAVGSLRNVHF